MLKKLGLMLIVVLALAGCRREQQNTNMVMNKEVPADFTTSQQVRTGPVQKAPALPGRAQILGAPFQDFTTQTGTATVMPSQDKTLLKPNSL